MKPRTPRTTGHDLCDLHWGFGSKASEKISRRKSQGLCIACGKTPCECRSTSRTKLVRCTSLKASELRAGLSEVFVTQEEANKRNNDLRGSYESRFRAGLIRHAIANNIPQKGINAKLRKYALPAVKKVELLPNGVQ